MNHSVRRLLSAFFVFGMIAFFAGAASAEILVRIEGLRGDSVQPGYEGWIRVDSFTFGVERSESAVAAKAGTMDARMGPVELNDFGFNKSLDSTSAQLAQAAMSGRTITKVEVAVVSTGPNGRPAESLRYTLEGVIVKSWTTSGDADERPTEEVSLAYGRIAFVKDGIRAGWDVLVNKPWDR